MGEKLQNFVPVLLMHIATNMPHYASREKPLPQVEAGAL